MSVVAKRLRPPYSQVVIDDPSAKVDVPSWRDGAPFVATGSCILFACLAEMDGETEFTLGQAAEVDPGHHPALDGILTTPGRRIALTTVWGDTILEMPTKEAQTRIRVWPNSPREPDRIVVGIG